MGFQEAVRTCLNKYVGFSGRARRSEYWFFYLFLMILSIIATFIDNALGLGFLSLIVSLAFLLPSLAAGIRRLHDTGRSGWWMLIALVPFVGIIVLIVFFVQDSAPGDNAYGPNPKGMMAAA